MIDPTNIRRYHVSSHWNPKQICSCHPRTLIVLPKLSFQTEGTNREANSSQNSLIDGQILSIFHHLLKSTRWWLSRKVPGLERNATCPRRPLVSFKEFTFTIYKATFYMCRRFKTTSCNKKAYHDLGIATILMMIPVTRSNLRLATLGSLWY